MILTEVPKENPDGVIGRKGKRTAALSVCMGSNKDGPVSEKCGGGVMPERMVGRKAGLIDPIE
jgi:hypothetical protein